jgi:hypothetical protein
MGDDLSRSVDSRNDAVLDALAGFVARPGVILNRAIASAAAAGYQLD